MGVGGGGGARPSDRGHCCSAVTCNAFPAQGVQIRRAGAGTEARLRCARQVWTSPEWLDEASDSESWERESEAAQASVSITTRAAA